MPVACRQQLAQITIGMAWFAFVVSFFLPAVSTLEVAGTRPGTPMTGLQTLRCMVLFFYWPLWIVEPMVLLFPVIGLANVAALLSPLACVFKHNLPWWMGLILLAGVASGLALPPSITGEPFVGYYVWIISMTVLACGAIGVGWQELMEGT